VEYRTLGRTGLRVSVLGFGCGNVGGLMIRGAPAAREAAVARALGSPPMNEFAARRERGRWVAEDGTELCTADSAGAERARLGVRAEHVAPEGGPSAAPIEVVEDAGHQKIVVVRLAGTRVHLIAPRTSALRPGQVLHPRIDPARVIVWH